MRLDEKYVQPKLLCPTCREKTDHVIDHKTLTTSGSLVLAYYTCKTCGKSHQAILGELQTLCQEFKAA